MTFIMKLGKLLSRKCMPVVISEFYSVMLVCMGYGWPALMGQVPFWQPS